MGVVVGRGRVDAAGDPVPGRRASWALLIAHLALLAVAIVLLFQPVDLDPERTAPSGTPTRCASIPVHDDLVHLALREPGRAAQQAARWIACQPSALERARDAIRWDYVFVATLTVAVGLAVVRGLRRTRWCTSAVFTLGFLALYLGCDLAENHLLSRSLDDVAALGSPLDQLDRAAELWPPALRWVAALKFGAAIAMLPMFLISLAIAFGDVLGERTVAKVVTDPAPTGGDEGPTTTVRAVRFVGDSRAPREGVAAASSADPEGRAAAASFFREPEDQRTPPVLPALPDAAELARPEPSIPPTMAVACSGGGIRSAAFNLGALQALDFARAAPSAPTEWQRVRTIAAVSGGSYLATAWVSARTGPGDDADRRWSRGSREESHLRRHSSYIAPGFAGKVWAAFRFGLGFLCNVGLVVLAIAAVALPYGWLVGEAQEPIPASGGGVIRVEQAGARILLASGRTLIPVENGTVRLGDGATASLRRDRPVVPPRGSADDDRDPRDVALDTALDAAADGRTLPAGTGVVLSARRDPVRVVGRVYGCVVAPDSPLAEATCPPRAARSIVLGDNATLVRAPRAVLTLDEDAVVEHRALIKACGAHACEGIADDLRTGWAWLLLGAAVVIGMVTVAARPRERLRSTHQRIFRIATGLALAAVLLLVLLPALVSWAEGQRWGIEERRRIAGVGTLTVILALISQVVPLLGSGSSPATKGPITTWLSRVGSKLKPWLMRLAAYVAAPLILLAIALFFASLGAQREIEPGQLTIWIALLGPLLIIGAGADLNQWSLHPYYRERLVSAFGVDPTTLREREPSMLGGLPADAIPELVVCAAANVNDTRITAPGRPVVPWEFSRRAVGAPKLHTVFGTDGTVPAEALDGKLVALQSLWTAVAVSGAAFSPSMGKMTRAERGLLALGNIRLGVWFPNPAMLGRDPDWYQRHHPSPVYLAKEAFGLHKATDRWIYVTDGGHYENLGLVELLRRGEQEIYCFDASGDAVDTFGTIAEAMRLAREELNIEIHLDPTPLEADADGISHHGAVAAWLTRRIDGVEEAYGWLILAKLEVPEDAPFDIVDLARTLPKFPNHPTTDQLYTDQKFEAYRALGYYLGERAAALAQYIRAEREGGPPAPIPEAVRAANRALAPVPAPADG